ncbi:MAG: reverse transcriptase domain-containing protein [bacterium]|nr:reverse transcriptase domain-containing protein [bacterium]
MLYLVSIREGLKGKPEFHRRILQDVNPLGGTIKTRVIYGPNQPMRVLHEQLIARLKRLLAHFPHATGAVQGSSPWKNVMRHQRGQRYFYLTDIENAYPSVRVETLALILCTQDVDLAGRYEQVVTFLKQYCLAQEGGLAIGAPASPLLFNIYAGVLIDRDLHALCEKYSLTYTRYLDDLTFSSKRPIGERKRKAIRAIIEEAGFRVNHRRSQVHDLRKGPIVITGVGLRYREGEGKERYRRTETFLPRSYLRKIRGLIHRAITKGDVNDALVEGMMGVFRDVTRFRVLNRTEASMVNAYNEYRKSRGRSPTRYPIDVQSTW